MRKTLENTTSTPLVDHWPDQSTSSSFAKTADVP